MHDCFVRLRGWTCLFLLLVAWPSKIPVTTAEPRTFVWLSDIHLDPFYGTDQAVGDPLTCGDPVAAASHPYSNFGCDSPPRLVESLLQRASSGSSIVSNNNNNNNTNGNSSSQPPSQAWSSVTDFMVITGDIVRHSNDLLVPNPMNATQSILQTVSQQIRHYFPTLPVAVAIGNNDVTPDYFFDVAQPRAMLDMLYGGLEPLLKGGNGNSTPDRNNNSNTLDDFRRGAYYAINVTERITVLSLNTVLYSINHQPPLPMSQQQQQQQQPNNNNNPDNDDPLGQFAWLKDQLVRAEQQNRVVYIIGHIPPTIGSYRHTQLWQERHIDRYYEIVTRQHCSSSSSSSSSNKEHPSEKNPKEGVGGRGGVVVKAQLFGHIHTDEFRIMHDVCPIYLTSSFTPIYGSNPSFRVVTFDSETGDLLDYHVQYLDLAMLGTANDNNATAVSSTAASTTVPYNSSAVDEAAVNNAAAAAVPWKQGISFTDAYQVPDMSLSSLKIIVEDLQNSTDHSIYWEALLNRLHVYTHGSEVCDAVCRVEWACTLTSKTAHEYNLCRYESYVAQDPLLVLGVFLVVALVLIFAAVAVGRALRRCRRRRHYQIPEMETQLEEFGREKQLPEVC